MADLGAEMQLLHDLHEVNARVDSFFDGQWNVRIGDDVNGYRESWLVGDADQAAHLLRCYRESLERTPNA